MSSILIFSIIVLLIILFHYIYTDGLKLGIIIFLSILSVGAIAGLVSEYATSNQKNIFIAFILLIGFFLNYPPSRNKIITWGKNMVNKFNKRSKK